MNLIEKYVAEVGKHLPLLKGREDIEKELKSTLEDMLEDRSTQAGRPRDEAMEIELLKEYGSPQKVASTYNLHPFLIGPRLFPLYLMVLKIVVAVVVSILLILTGIRAATIYPMMGADFVQVVGKGLGNALSAAIAVFGNVTLVFAILERTLPEKEIGDFSDGDDWDPAALAKEPNPDTVKRGDLIAEIVFTFIGLAVLNGAFQIPIFSETFTKFIPWINAVFLAEIALDVYLLYTARWALITRVAKIFIEAAGMAITVILLRTPGVIGFTSDVFGYIPPESSVDLEKLIGIFNVSVPIALVVALIIQGIELAKAVYGLIRMKR
ncbi:MAG: hypothetical protein IPP66_02455 [Anaerolineales bacterium]|nr:hypothetical protein [Anaerolineales bacterium]